MQAFLTEWKNKPIEAVVEQMSNGTTVRVRLLLADDQHQIALVQMAGARAPRAPQNNPSAVSDDTPSAASALTSSGEEYGAEALAFTSARLLQRNVTIELIGLPPNPSPSTPFIAVVSHPAGNIASLLLQHGLAKCVDLHAGLLGAERMSALRKSETDAKNNKRGVWKSSGAANGLNGVNGSAGKMGKAYDALVVRIVSGDTITVRKGKDGEGEERKITLSSVRQPK